VSSTLSLIWECLSPRRVAFKLKGPGIQLYKNESEDNLTGYKYWLAYWAFVKSLYTNFILGQVLQESKSIIVLWLRAPWHRWHRLSVLL